LPTTIYLALATADITAANVTANEVSTSLFPAYVRRDCAVGGAIASGWVTSVNGASSNAKEIVFPAKNGATTVTVTHIALYDAITGGNLLYHAPLTSPKVLTLNLVANFAIGSIPIQSA
jgi:hypothetical protein